MITLIVSIIGIVMVIYGTARIAYNHGYSRGQLDALNSSIEINKKVINKLQSL